MLNPQFTVQVDSESSDFGRFVIEPLPQGYGHTLGNSLRRVLYSSIPGAAITQIKVAGATHQFATLDGVQEDLVQLCLALKDLHFKYSGTDPVTVVLSARGPGEVKASEFELPGDIKLSNPDAVVAHLADKSAKLEIEATIESGLGYSPAEDRKSNTVGMIPLDASYTPVTRVNYEVTATRVGRVTNFDKLTLEIYTNGTVTPKSALTTATQTLITFLQSVIDPQSVASSSSSPSTSQSHASGSGPLLAVEELDLPTRIANALQKAGFETVTDLIKVPKAELAKVKNVGTKSVKIIELALKERGFELQ